MKMEEWKECRLGDYCDFQNGYAFKSSEFKTNGEYKIVKIKELKDGLVKFFDDSASVDIHDIKEFEKYKIYRNDVLFALTGDPVSKPNPLSWVGRVSIYRSDENALLNQRTCKIKKSDEIDNQFLYYYFRQWENFYALASKATGSASQANISTNTIADTIIKLPPLPTQQKIARILSSLDDKIELNNKINTNLEQQAGALFKNWFVDFEPFGGKMPDGWKEADIYSIANIIYGSPFASKLFNTEKNGKPIIRIRDLKDQHSDVYTPEERDDAYLIQPKDIVVGMDGEFRPYIWGSEPGWLNQRVCVFENKRPKGKAFLFFSIKPLLDVVEKTQVATTVIHIGKKDFDKFQITLPTEDILDKFDELTDPILDQIVANRLENRRLAELRDTLLPKLMNGKIEVNEVRI